MSLTNNEVKFLVTLDINEDKSKKKIEGFLEKTIKEQKITFDVAVGKSEQNINEFLKKHKEKKASILFDVTVGKSESNISTYLKNRKQDTQSLIFYVNENATKAKINGTLNKMIFNEALVELKVDTKLSLQNINRFIDNSKVNKKNIELDIDNTAFDTINTKINNKKLNRAKILLGLSQGSFDDIGNAVANRTFTGAKFAGSLDVEATVARIEKQINKMKLPNLTLNVDPIVSPIKQSSQSTSKPVKQTVTQTPSNDVNDSDLKSLKEIRDEYKALGQTVELFNKSREEGEEAFIRRLKAQGKQVEIIRNAQTQEITKITTTYKNSANEVQKDVFVPIIRQYKETSKASEETVKEVRGFVNEINKLKNTEKFNLTQEIDKFKRKLEEARHTATATNKVLTDFGKKADTATSRNELEKLNSELEKHQAQKRKQIQLEKEQYMLLAQQEQLMSNLTRIQKMYLRTVDKDEANRLKESIKALKELDILKAKGGELTKLDMGSVREAREQISIVNNDVKRLNANATEASKASLGVVASLKTAMEKFPIWMIASTAFYGAIGTFREFGSVIIDIDKKMTDLKKVMSDDTDFGAIFDQATTSAETFGKTISETLDAYSMFAKQGYKGDELQTLANAGLVAGNVGDIEAGKASEYLTASLLQWNKESSEAMGVVDGWNEISNNFATTVENLAQGQAKAGATAKALGMDFDQLNAVVGTLNARTKQSGNEIGNFIKSTFSNVLSNKGRDVLAGLGVELENADGTMRDIMQVYKEVAIEYKNLNQAEQNQVVLGLGGKYHVARLQTLLDDLGSVDSMYDQMYDTSQNSANSAMEENQKYMQSLEARINLARVEIEKLALAIGEAFMTEGMVQALQAFRILAEAITSVVKEVGFLPLAFLGTVTILATLSNRFGDVIGSVGRWVGSMGKAKQALNDQTIALSDNNKENVNNNRSTTELVAVHSDSTKETDKNTDSTDKNTEAKKRASKASKLLSVGFGVLGIASIGVGFAIEGLLGWLGKARKEEEEFNNTLNEQIATFEANQEQITTLSKRYSQLSDADKSIEAGTEEYAELTEIQNELARLLPTVKKGEDGLGNSIIQSAGYIEQKVAMMEKQLEIQKKLNEEEALAKREEDEETARENVEDSKDDADKVLGQTGNNIYKFKNAKNYKDDSGKSFNLMDELGLKSWDEDLKNAEQMSLAITKIREALLKKDEYGFSDGYTKQMEIALESLVEKYQKVEKANLKVLTSTDILRDGYISDIDEMVEGAVTFEDDALEAFKSIASGALGLSETEEEFKAFNEAIEGVFSQKDSQVEFSKSFNSLQTAINNMKNSSIEDLDEFKKKYKSSTDEIIANILKLSGLKVGSPEYKNYEAELKGYTKGIYDHEVALRRESKTRGKSLDETREHVALYGLGGDAVEGLTDTMEEYVNSIQNFSSVGEQLLGVTEKQITETEDLLSVYSHLSNVTDKTTEEQEIYTDALNKLNALYPHLVENGKIRIDNIKVENEMNKVLTESFKNLSDEKYNAEETMTYHSAVGSKKRIENLKIELEALKGAYDDYKKMASDGFGENNEEIGYLIASGVWGQAKEYEDKSSKLDAEVAKLNTGLNSLSSSNTKYSESEKKSSDTKEKSTKETSELEKATDKYALALEKLDTQLAKIQAKQKGYATHSKQYRDSILEENKLIEQQISLNKQKSNDIAKAPRTSTTTTSSSNSKSIDYNTFTNVKPKGWNNTITSQYGMRNGSMHNGIDVDGAIGDTLQSNVNGKVLKAGNASDIGEHWSYGNLVIIQDTDNKKHYYAHLDDVSVVKGQELSAGTKIGTIGNSGNVVKGKGGDGSHLHYGVKNGNNWENPYGYVQQARTGVQAYGTKSTSSSSSSSSSNTKDDYNDRLSEIESIEQENTALYEQLQENKYRIVESRLEEYARSVSLEDGAIAKQESLQNNMLEHSQAYEKSVRKQMDSENAKLKLYQSEYDYLQKMYDSGELTDAQEENLLNRRYELQQLMVDSQNQAKQYYNEVISGYLAKLDNRMDDYADTLAWEQVKIQSLSRESERYNKTLEIMKKTRQGQVNTIKEELSYVNRMLSKGNLSIEMYENLAQRANELKRELVETTLAIQDLNYEMIQTKVIVADEKIDDIDFKISRSQSIRSRYDEDSGDYYKELGYEVEQLEDKLVELADKEKHLKDSLSNPAELGHDELQNLEEQLEDTSLAYQEVQTSIHQTKKAMDEFNSSIDKEVKELKESLADDIIDMLKDAIEDLRDIQIEAIEDLIEAEEERHEKVMQQLDDELDRYNDIIDAKRREINDEDRDRTHDNKLDELTTRKQDLESKITLLSSSNVYADIKEREGLQKELADVEKEIEEENYQYSKELREQQLDDLLKAKEDNIDEQKKLEEKNSANTLKELNRQKEYWDKYYDEILSDEANFQRIRREVIAGNHDIIETEFNQHLGVLKDSLNKMGVSFDSMTSITGKKIKDNILSSLTLIREEITRVSSEIDKILAKKNTVTNGFGSSYDFDDSILDNSNRPNADKLPDSSQTLTEANLKVILAKFMNEQIAGSLNPKTDSTRITNIKDKADKLAEEGRAQGATIMSTESLKGLFDRFTPDEMKQVGSYFQSNASSSGFQTQDYTKYIQQFGNTASQDGIMTTGDKQVMFAKYLKEYLMPQVKDSGYRSAVGATADKIAQNGRSNTSLIKSDVSYSQAMGRLSNSQQGELGDFFLSNAGVIGNETYRKLLESYANGTLIPKRNSPASLDSGGYTGSFGSTGGVDGKGGKYAVLHQREIVLNPLDTERMFQISAIMENVMKNIGKAISLPTLPKIHQDSAPTSSDNSTHIHINIDKMNGTQSDIDKLSKQIQNKLLREKGKR